MTISELPKNSHIQTFKTISNVLITDLELENKHSFKNGYEFIDKIKNAEIKNKTSFLRLYKSIHKLTINEVLDMIRRKLSSKINDNEFKEESNYSAPF